MFWNQYPYLNLNDLNLDYILKAIGEMRYEVTNFVSINAIKYANPIQWDITSQYEKNTIVIDPVTGTAYISVSPVPAGVALTRPEYWTVVFDLGSFVTRAAQNFTSRWESETTTTATFPTATGEWLVWGDVLYKALTNITAGDTYVVNGNIEHFTIEDLYDAYLNTIASILAMVGDLVDLNTTDKTSIVNAINEVLQIANDNAADIATNTNDIATIMKNNVVETCYASLRLRQGAKHYYTYPTVDPAIYESFQGFTKAEDKYVAMLIPIEYQYNFMTGYISDLAVLVEYDDSFNELRRSAPLRLYHGRNMTYNNGKLYVNGSSSGNTTLRKIIVVDYDTFTIDREITLTVDIGAVLFFKDGSLYAGTEQTIYVIDVTTDAIVDTIDISTKNLPNMHSVKPYADGYIGSTNYPNTIMFMDGDFNLVKVVNFTNIHANDGEIKDFAIDGTKAYLTQNSRTYVRLNGVGEYSEVYKNIFRIDLYNSQTEYPTLPEDANAEYNKTKIVYVNEAQAQNVKRQTGSNSAPFGSVMMAVNYGYRFIVCTDTAPTEYVVMGSALNLKINGASRNIDTLILDEFENCDIAIRSVATSKMLRNSMLRGCRFSAFDCLHNDHVSAIRSNIVASADLIIEEAADTASDLFLPSYHPYTSLQKYDVLNASGNTINVEFSALSEIGDYILNLRATYQGNTFTGNVSVAGRLISSAIIAPLYTQSGGVMHKLDIMFTLSVVSNVITSSLIAARYDETSAAIADVAITRLLVDHII